MPSLAIIAAFAALSMTTSLAAPYKRNTFSYLQKISSDAVLFSLGDVTYLANTKYPKASLTGGGIVAAETASIPILVVNTNATTVTKDVLEKIISNYLDLDDVFTEDFLEGVCIFSSANAATLDASATDYLAGLDVKHTMLGKSFSSPGSYGQSAVSVSSNGTHLPAGPYLASVGAGEISLSTVYRVYEDTYRDFLFGVYETGDAGESHTGLDVSLPNFGYPAIPVPSRIYYLDDPRPLAGERVAVKDLFDIKGVKTSAGSQAWAYITPVANETAPSIKQIVDLGGVLVGKFKLAQFASGANPWDWQDEHYPFNPRGDGWLTCSASSSGGGCSIAAYDWLDYAIGSDTGSSMRRPAAVSGTYGQRPSQGMITLERVVPLGGATDTAGVFSRDPYKWIKFSKAWYSPSLHQPPNITGLSPLVVPDNNLFPKTILYPDDYLPLNNSAAEAILQNFIANLTSVFGMTVRHFNFTATVESASDPDVANITQLTNGALGVVNSYTQWTEVADPLITAWNGLFDGRFPPIDVARRPGWRNYTLNGYPYTIDDYNLALAQKNAAVEWFEENLLYSTRDSCSEGLFLYDIGTGGFPSYRELNLNGPPNTTFLAVTPPGAAITGAGICPLYGCADFTIPIGQVPYWSNVTFYEEMVPVTINMVVKRGCDFVLYNMIERLADEGVLATVKTGRTAF